MLFNPIEGRDRFRYGFIHLVAASCRIHGFIVRAFHVERCENAHSSGLPVPFHDVEDVILADSEITGDPALDVTQALRNPLRRTLGVSAHRRLNKRINRFLKAVLDLDRWLAAPAGTPNTGSRVPVPPRVPQDHGKWSNAQPPSLPRPGPHRHGQGARFPTQRTIGGSSHPDAATGPRTGAGCSRQNPCRE